MSNLRHRSSDEEPELVKKVTAPDVTLSEPPKQPRGLAELMTIVAAVKALGEDMAAIRSRLDVIETTQVLLTNQLDVIETYLTTAILPHATLEETHSPMDTTSYPGPVAITLVRKQREVNS